MNREVVVRTVPGAGPFANEVSVGTHRLPADEPADAGGADGGPAPFELLLAALGACTSVTLRMYARRKGWDLRGVEVRLTRAGPGGGGGPEDGIRRVLLLDGALDGEQRRRLLEIAGKCPVHRALTKGVAVETTLG